MVMVDPEILNYAQITDAVSSKRRAFYIENLVFQRQTARQPGALTTTSLCPTMPQCTHATNGVAIERL
jgi:hypothetical protein